MTSIGTDIDKKLCLTAAFVGAMTRKELAAAFHRANPRTSFDVERAHKWIQGRARPRERALYDDWALVLGGVRTADWIAHCALGDFIDALCTDGAIDRTQLMRRADAFAGDGRNVGPEAAEGAAGADLVGEYACYSHAWSPYFVGRIIRGALVIAQSRGGGLRAGYAEALPSGVIRSNGRPRMLRNALYLDLFTDGDSAAYPMMLFPATPPARVLGGLMFGAPVLSSEPRPCVTRIALFRLAAREDETAPPRALGTCAYLGAGASVAGDLVDLGVPLEDTGTADRVIHAFLGSAGGGARDQIGLAAYHDLVAFFDGEWARRAEP